MDPKMLYDDEIVPAKVTEDNISRFSPIFCTPFFARSSPKSLDGGSGGSCLWGGERKVVSSSLFLGGILVELDEKRC